MGKSLVTPVFVITAFRLADGHAVYLARDHAWSERIADAEPGASEDALEGSLGWARGQEAVVCDPYVMKAALEDGRVVPVSARERIRATGAAWVRERFGYEV